MKIISFVVALAAALTLNSAHSAGIEIPTDTSQKAKPATIRVLLAKNKKAVFLEAKGSYGVYNPLNDLMLASGTTAKQAPIVFYPQGMTWGDQFPDISSIRIVPHDAKSTLLVDGIEYRGCVELHAKEGGLTIINEVDIERYLKSTLTLSFPEELENEVLEAVAIVARTHAYYKMTHEKDAFWHSDAQEVDYQGHALTLQNLPLHQAIINTRNMILSLDGSPFPATWTKDSAGQTADFTKVFRKNVKAPPGVATPIAGKERDKHMWSFEISKRELARIAGIQKITDIGLFQDKESHKNYALKVKNGQQSRTIDFFTLQKALGLSSLKSNDFIVKVKGDKVSFIGYGEGHGVGLCLLSASFYADKGENAEQILKHFFPHTQLEHMSN